MLDSLVQAVLLKVDVNVRKQLSDVICMWPQVSPKWQLHLASIELKSRIECLNKDNAITEAQSLLFGSSLLDNCSPEVKTRARLTSLLAVESLVQSGSPLPSSFIDSLISTTLVCEEEPQLLAQGWLSIPTYVSANLRYPWSQSGVLPKALRFLDAPGIAAEKDYRLAQGVIKTIAAIAPLCMAGDAFKDEETIPDDEDGEEEEGGEDETEETGAHEGFDADDDEDMVEEMVDEEKTDDDEDDVVNALIDKKEFGLFGRVVNEEIEKKEIPIVDKRGEAKFTCWLLTRISYIVRNLLKSPSCSILRLAACIKLSMALISPMLTPGVEIPLMLRPIISTLVRLSTIRLFFREVAEEGETALEVTTLGGLASLPTNRQLSTVVRLAEEALAGLEDDCKNHGTATSDAYNAILISVRSSIQKTRTQRKVDKKQLAVLDPKAFAAQKIKRMEVKKAKNKIKRVDFIQNKRRMIQ